LRENKIRENLRKCVQLFCGQLLPPQKRAKTN